MSPDDSSTASAGGPATSLAGKRVLVVEDEFLVAVLIQEILADIGCEVAGLASDLDDALAKAETLAFDLAILDVNLRGEQSLPVAEKLAERRLAFVLATGYGSRGVSPAFPDAPIVTKPFQQRDIEAGLRKALAQRPAPA